MTDTQAPRTVRVFIEERWDRTVEVPEPTEEETIAFLIGPDYMGEYSEKDLVHSADRAEALKDAREALIGDRAINVSETDYVDVNVRERWVEIV